MTDPESPATVDREAGDADDVGRDLPVEADDADVYDQRRDVPDDDEDGYR